jgi:hypothetical protein
MKRISLLLIVAAFAGGCAEIKPPTPIEVIQQPLGTKLVRIGMTQSEVKQLWGQPDAVEFISTDKTGTVKEKWIYRARYPKVPVEVNYLSRTYYLFFDGNNLVRIRPVE